MTFVVMKRLTRKLRRDNTRSLSPTRVHFSVEKVGKRGPQLVIVRHVSVAEYGTWVSSSTVGHGV